MLRQFFARHLKYQVWFIPYFQKICGVRKTGPTNPILHLLFSFGAATGNELFFLSFLPSIFWFDDELGRKMMLLWSASYYVGQCMKDVLKLPRPTERDIVVLESQYLSEFGVPSTHCMNAVSMPTYLCYLVFTKYSLSSAEAGVLVSLCLFWMVTCILSRFYMGVHYILDAIVGSCIGFFFLIFYVLFSASIDSFLASLPILQLVCLLQTLTIALSYLYPKEKVWANSVGDTILILGATNGALVGSYLRHASKEMYFAMDTSTFMMIALIPVKFLVGVAILAIVRAISKYSCIFVLTRLLPPVEEKARGNEDDIDRSLSVVQTLLTPKGSGKKNRDKQVRNAMEVREGAGVAAAQSSASRYAIELPTKTITYSLVGFFATNICPKIFQEMDRFIVEHYTK
jgi:membrane-associated phospholipid phosphatase